MLIPGKNKDISDSSIDDQDICIRVALPIP
jgi:hypothetical protein